MNPALNQFINRLSAAGKYKRPVYLWLLIFIEIVFLTGYLYHQGGYFTYQFNGDEPGYLMFPFSPLKAMLDNHRSFGLPVFISIFNLFTHDFFLWPYYQYLIYILSILFLFWAILKSGTDRIFSFIFLSLILWDTGIYTMFPPVRTEMLCIAFLHLTLGMMFIAVRYNRWFTNLFFALCLFLLYQIRPNVSYIAFVAPFWAIMIAFIFQGYSLKTARSVFIRFTLTSILPLFLFGLLRFIVVGQFGFATMTGGTLSGHAVQYLDEKNVILLKGESKIIGDEILRRKRLFTYPCNLSPFKSKIIPNQSPIITEADCFPSNLMMAWLVAIKHETGIEPFRTPEENLEAWKHTLTLSPFYMKYYHATTDKILMNFSKEILKIEWKQYLNWLVGSAGYGLAMFFGKKELTAIYFLCLGIAFAVQFWLRIGPGRKLSFSVWQRQILALSFISLSNFILGFIPLLIFNYPFERMFVTMTPYLFPSIILWAIPPLWLPKKKSWQGTG